MCCLLVTWPHKSEDANNPLVCTVKCGFVSSLPWFTEIAVSKKILLVFIKDKEGNTI